MKPETQATNDSQNQQETTFQKEVIVLIYSNSFVNDIQGVFSSEETLDEYLEQHSKVLQEQFFDTYVKKLSKKEAKLAAKAEAAFSIANYYFARKFTLHRTNTEPHTEPTH